MYNMKMFTHCALLSFIPTLFIYPQNELHTIKLEVEYQQEIGSWIRPTTYDEIMQMFEDLETGELEKKYTFSQLKQLNQYLAILANEGLLPDQIEEGIDLEEDIYDLMYGEDDVFRVDYDLDNNNEYMIVPALYNGNSTYRIIQCGKVHRAWEKTKKFAKKHKKILIVGGVVVIAVTAIAVAVVAAASSAAAAAAGSLDSNSSKSNESGTEEPIIAVSKELFPSFNSNEAPMMKAAIDEHFSSFKEFIKLDNDAQQINIPRGWDGFSFREKVREVGSHIAHQAFDEITDLVKIVPQLCEDVKEIGAKFLSSDFNLSNSLSTMDSMDSIENFENMVAKGHETIDKSFLTDQAEFFTTEAKKNAPKFAIGVIPLPGMIYGNGNINVKEFSKLGMAPDRAGYTKAGRSSMKHGYREGRTVFEKPVGNPEQINEHGQKVLEKILNHPEKKIVQYTHKIHGAVIEIEAPEIGGVRFTGDGGEMMGFLEPKQFKQ